MTDDLDRRAALLMGWRECEIRRYADYLHRAGVECRESVDPDDYCEGDFHLHPRPTSNPADTRALVQHVIQRGVWAVNSVVTGGWAQAWVQFAGSSVPVADSITNPAEDGPNYDLIAVTRACVAALEASKEAQDG